MLNGSLVAANAQNKATGDVVNTRSKFPLSYEFFDTHRFGEYHPHFWFDGVEGDENVRLRSSHDVRSYTLKAPLLQDIQMKKDYFLVPMQAILPNNWEKWHSIPVNGDDVPSDCGLGVEAFWLRAYSCLGQFYNALTSYFTNNNRTVIRMLAGVLRYLTIGEYFFSSGSLCNSMGVRGNRYIYFTKTENGVRRNYTFDEYYDAFISYIAGSGIGGFNFYTTDNNLRYHVVFDGNLRNDSQFIDVDFHTALQLIRDNPFFQVTSTDVNITPSSTFATGLVSLFNSFTVNSFDDVDLGTYNLSRVFAYQIVCSHFYTNDHVDYVFSASLYRELIGNYVHNVLGQYDNFVFNGLRYEYDYCSAHYCSLILNYISVNASSLIAAFQDNASAVNSLAYLSAIFSYKRSLRFLDYFTGTRTQPLAVGDVNIDVAGTSGNMYVSAVDVTRNISRQRLLNAVNRVGAKWENYIELMSGRKPAPDYHNPFYLGHTSDAVFGSESEYTGNASDADKQNVTSVLRSNGGRFEFNVDFIDRPSVVIGITYYDLPRVYGRAFERQTFILDRYDMFNKYMQFVGDQEVNSLEIGVVNRSSTTGIPVSGEFSYQNRDMQYKQRFNQLAGGFGVPSTDLDVWLYRADDVRTRHDHLDPDFIRSYNSEFDKFFISLTGYSLGTYFHFIVRNINDCSASRPMAYAPSIL